MARALADGNVALNRHNAFMSADARTTPREMLGAPGTIYDKNGEFLLPCVVRDLSKGGGRLELFKDVGLPKYFHLSMMPDGSARQLCSKVWQLACVAGVHFIGASIN